MLVVVVVVFVVFLCLFGLFIASLTLLLGVLLGRPSAGNANKVGLGEVVVASHLDGWGLVGVLGVQLALPFAFFHSR